MPEQDHSMTRRSFVEKVALAAGIAAAGEGLFESLKPATVQASAGTTPPTGADFMNSGAFGWDLTSAGRQAAAAPAADTLTPANLTVNPNILMIMVDQLRLPQFWLTADQQYVVDTMCPNIAWLRNTSYNFVNFYVCAQACTPSRATLLTGLYAPQTGVFSTQVGSGQPDLNPNYAQNGNPSLGGFPTFGNALQDIAGYSAENVLWFGKWHVSNQYGQYVYNYSTGPKGGFDTMPLYGFNSGRSSQILWPSYYGSPSGSANEGNNGYLYTQSGDTGEQLAAFGGCDQSIVNDFVNNWAHNFPTKTSPWFACAVSSIRTTSTSTPASSRTPRRTPSVTTQPILPRKATSVTNRRVSRLKVGTSRTLATTR
jgi:hypothetical protein